MQLSPQQQDVMSWTTGQQGHLNLIARAGTGKTTTLIELCSRIGGQVFLGAFNKKIAQEIQARLESKNLAHCKASTMHAAGFGAWKRVSPSCGVNESKMYEICKQQNIKYDEISEYCKIVSLAKQFLYAGQEAPAEWEYIWDQYEVSLSYSTAAVTRAKELLAESVKHNETSIDFDDMLYAPLVAGCKLPTYDWVLVDEAQDTNPTRRELAIRMMNPTGRLIAVGDDRQCQPLGTLVKVVRKKADRWRDEILEDIPIEDIEPGDSIVGYCVADSAFYKNRKVKQVDFREFNGDLVIVRLGCGQESRYTPEHKCLASFAAIKNHFGVYLMEREGCFRVGMTRLQHKAEEVCGPTSRLRAEKADRLWLLAAFESRQDALICEAINAALFGLPTLMFTTKNNSVASQEELDSFWRQVSEDRIKHLSRAVQLLDKFGRLLDFPLINKTDPAWSFSIGRPRIIQACNLLSGCSVLPFTGKRHAKRSDWVQAEVSRELYLGKVCSLEVECGLYVADGITTHNSIYGFTGADADAMDLIKDRLDSTVLPLTVTYRCPQRVVQLAQKWVPDIEAHESNGLGEIHHVDEKEFDIFKPADSDVILCRLTRPLIALAYNAIQRGRGVRVEGRDIGRGLLKLAQRFKEDNLRKILPRLQNYLVEERDRLQQQNKLTQVQNLEDKCESLSLMISQSLEDGGSTIEHLKKRIESLFGDTQGKQTLLTLSTIHKSKGREWNHVWLWGRNIYQPFFYAQRAYEKGITWPMRQEDNLCYVGVTRTKQILSEIVCDQPWGKGAK